LHIARVEHKGHRIRNADDREISGAITDSWRPEFVGNAIVNAHIIVNDFGHKNFSTVLLRNVSECR